jgi:hypothetical protein
VTGKTPRDDALAESDAYMRAHGLDVIENTSKETTVTFIGPKGAAAMKRKLLAEESRQPDDDDG